MTSVLDRLGARAATLSYDEIEPRGLEVVRTALIDTLGVALAGADFEGSAIARAVAVPADSAGASLILGTTDRTNSLDAGMLNGMASHALDYDDGTLLMVGHPSTMLVPALLALGEEIDASARDFIVAYAAGYEVMIRISRGVNMAHYEKGWHPTSTIGVLGVAAAAARMLGLDSERTATAISISTSMAAGIKANFGTMVKAWHIGQAVRNGLSCAKLAANGFTANRGALEAPQGFLNVYNGAGHYDAEAIVAGIDAVLEVNRQHNTIKSYPCCHSTHSSINAAMDIRLAHAPQGSDVDRVRVLVDPQRMPHTDRPHLQEALSGKFSLQYVVSRALVDGRVVLADFDGEAHLDPAVLEMMERVEVVGASPGELSNAFSSRVTVTTISGETFEAASDPAGDPTGVGEGGRLLWEKFRDCASHVLDPASASSVVAALGSFPEFGDVREFMRMVEGPIRVGSRAS